MFNAASASASFLTRTVHYYDLLHHRHVCGSQKSLTPSCPLVDVLSNVLANVKDVWKDVGGDGYII